MLPRTTVPFIRKGEHATGMGRRQEAKAVRVALPLLLSSRSWTQFRGVTLRATPTYTRPRDLTTAYTGANGDVHGRARVEFSSRMVNRLSSLRVRLARLQCLSATPPLRYPRKTRHQNLPPLAKLSRSPDPHHRKRPMHINTPHKDSKTATTSTDRQRIYEQIVTSSSTYLHWYRLPIS